MIDVDHFKAVNDTHGHATGDAVLQAFAANCEHAVRAFDRLGRLGGEEFLVVLEETSEPDALSIAERLRRGVEALEVSTPSGRVRITASIGVATFRQAEDTVDGLLRRADEALYQAKAAGRNRVLIAAKTRNPVATPGVACS